MKKNYLRVVVMVLILTMVAGLTAFAAISPETDNNGGVAVDDGRISPMKYQSGEYAARIEKADIQKVGEVVFADEMNDIKKGKQVAVGLYVTDAKEEENNILFAEARGQNMTIAATIDIKMYKRDVSDPTSEDQLVELKGYDEIPFTLKVPNELAEVSGLKVYYMRPNEEGVDEVVPVPAQRTVNDNGVFLTIRKVRHFTPFQIVYEKGAAAAPPLFDDTGEGSAQQPEQKPEQKPEQQPTGDKKPEGTTSDVAKTGDPSDVAGTGDTADMALWLMMAVSACGAGFVAFAKKKAVR